MPELPEVETVRRQLAERIVGRTVTAFSIDDEKFASPHSSAALVDAVVGRRITAVERRGKYLLLCLDDGNVFVVHLRMTGQLLWRAGAPDDAQAFVRSVIVFDDASTLTFSDMRRFGRGWIVAGGEDGEGYWARQVGIEPLSARFTVDALAAALAGRRGPLKGALLNQRLIAGFGNIYADEALFAARLHPERPAGSLNDSELHALHHAMVERLRVAVDAGGSSIDTYRDSLGNPGTMQNLLQVHLRAGEPCPRCGEPIVKTRVVQRGTYWCPVCQER